MTPLEASVHRVSLECRECGFQDEVPAWMLKALARCMAGSPALQVVADIGVQCPGCPIGILVNSSRFAP